VAAVVAVVSPVPAAPAAVVSRAGSVVPASDESSSPVHAPRDKEMAAAINATAARRGVRCMSSSLEDVVPLDEEP
jgi:hypothetical protein